MKTSYFIPAKKSVPVLVFFLAFCLLSHFSQAQIVSKKFKPGAATGEDALVYTTYGCTPSGYISPVESLNFGNIDEIDIFDWTLSYLSCSKGTRRSLVRFTELKTLPPKTVKIMDAKLNLFCVNSSPSWGTSCFSGSPYTLDNPGWVERVTGSWVESSVTWDIQPSTTTASKAGIPKSAARWGWSTSIDVTDLVNDILVSGANNGFMLRLETEAYYRATLFASSDHADATLWPELLIIYDSSCRFLLSRFKDSTTSCSNVQFIDLSVDSAGTISSWKWDFGDATTSSLQNPLHSYAAYGTYPVRLIVASSNGCKDTFTKNVTITPIKFANFKDSVITCFQNQFTDKSTGTTLSWKWDFGDGTTAAVQNPLHTFPGYGTYFVRLISESMNGCLDTFSKNIIIKRIRFVNFKDSATTCFQYQFTDSSNLAAGSVISWKWSFGDGSGSAIEDPIHTFPGYGSYKVRLIAENSKGCPDTITKSLNILFKAFAGPAKDTSVCLTNGKATVQLKVAEGYSSYIWIPASGLSNPNISSPTSTFSANTKYQVYITDSFGCVDSVAVMVNLFPLAEINARPKDTAVCIDTELLLWATGGKSYVWHSAAGLSDPLINNPKLIVKGPVSYVVTGTDDNGCVGHDSLKISLLPSSGILATPKNTIGCKGNKINLHVSGAKSYKWFPSNGLNNDDISDPELTINGTATYVVKGTNEFGCPGYDSVFIIQYPEPVINAYSDQNIIQCREYEIRLNVMGANSYSWSPAEYCSDKNSTAPLVNPPKTTLFTVIGTDGNGCHGTDTISVIYNGAANATLPNAFTPNADQKNDVFRIVDYCNFTLSSFTIYNRWGTNIFTSSDRAGYWDGTFNGRDCEVGVYFYLVKGQSLNGEEIIFKGDFTLIR